MVEQSLTAFLPKSIVPQLWKVKTASILIKTKMHGWCADQFPSFFLLLAGERMSFSTVMTERSLPCGGTNDSK